MHTPVGTLEEDAPPPPYSSSPDQTTAIDVEMMSRVLSLRNKDECKTITNRYDIKALHNRDVNKKRTQIRYKEPKCYQP